MREVFLVAAVTTSGYVAACVIDVVGNPANVSLATHLVYMLGLKIGLAN